MELLENAKKELELLEKTEQELQEQLKLAPKGILHVSKSNGVFQYYSIKNGRKNYIPVKNKQLVKTLIQRDYNKRLMKTVTKDILALKTFLHNYSQLKLQQCFSKLPAARKVLVNPFFTDDTTFAKQWQAQKYEAKKEEPAGSLETLKNEHVRSKSEVIIANMLNAKGIPYHYEFPLKINGSVTLYPDFFCLNKRTRKEFYWEHCGKMGNPEYSGNLVSRLALYAQKDILPGKNLILTMETLEHPLNTRDVERVIKAFLE